MNLQKEADKILKTLQKKRDSRPIINGKRRRPSRKQKQEKV